MTFEELIKANDSIVTTGISKKDKKSGQVVTKNYAEVPQRIKAFRMLIPNGSIVTDLVSLEDGVAIFKATVMDESGKVLGTGTAYEKEGSSFINETSYIENCETSAVGRALAMCGIGIDLSIASYEEVSNAMLNQGAKADEKANAKDDNKAPINNKEEKGEEFPDTDDIQKLMGQVKILMKRTGINEDVIKGVYKMGLNDMNIVVLKSVKKKLIATGKEKK